jgi:hypothetical protein
LDITEGVYLVPSTANAHMKPNWRNVEEMGVAGVLFALFSVACVTPSGCNAGSGADDSFVDSMPAMAELVLRRVKNRHLFFFSFFVRVLFVKAAAGRTVHA